MTVDIGGRTVDTWGYGGVLPGKEIRLAAGSVLVANLRNDLPESTSIHWHGLAIRNDMDGVPGTTRPPIAAGEQFSYRFIVPDPGTYWFHPHSGLQLDRGLYAPLVIEDPADAGNYDVDQVIVIDDFLDGLGTTPEATFKSLTAMGGQDSTPGKNGNDGSCGNKGMDGMSGMGDQSDQGDPAGQGDAAEMPDFSSKLLKSDAGDVAYPMHLINGRPPTDAFTVSAPAGSRVRLRLINAGSDTAYRVSVGGHRMTVTHADGFAVEPVVVDSLFMGMGERYDVTVEPQSGVWPVVALAEGKDATAVALIRTTDAVVSAPPPLNVRPAELDGRLLDYSQLRAVEAVQLDTRAPDNQIQLRLTGSMKSYDWGIDGKKFPAGEPVEIEQGQRVRLTFKNTTAMFHPMHLHGHTFRLGGQRTGPRKDTVNVLPGRSVAVDFDADNPGQWMVHCHNTYHLESGMATVVSYVA